MAALVTTRPVAALSAGRLTSTFATLVANIAAWNDARITRNALTKLSARELEDIGLSFGDIDQIVARTTK